jgi:hypothetical protein
MDSVLPATDYTADFEAGSIKDVMADIGAKPNNGMLMVPLDKIYAPPGLNVRVPNLTYEDRIEEIANSIMANGFYLHQALPAQIIKLDGESVVSITGGFTRHKAALRARDMGYPIIAVPVILRAAGGNDLDIQCALFVDNTGTPLIPWEKGVIIKRLVGGGYSNKEICERLNITDTYVRKLLFLHSLPMAFQKLAMDDVIKANRIINTVKRVGVDKAYEVLTAERPKRSGVTTRTQTAAIDLALNLPSANACVEFLTRWRGGDTEAVEEVNATLRKPRKPRAPAAPRARKPRRKADNTATEFDL